MVDVLCCRLRVVSDGAPYEEDEQEDVEAQSKGVQGKGLLQHQANRISNESKHKS